MLKNQKVKNKKQKDNSGLYFLFFNLLPFYINSMSAENHYNMICMRHPVPAHCNNALHGSRLTP